MGIGAVWIWMLSTAQADPLPSGQYGMYLKTATHSHVPVLGKLPGASVTWLSLEILTTPEGTEMVQTTCVSTMEGAGERASVRLSEGFLDALPVKSTPLQWHEEGGSWRLSADLGVEHIGYDPALTDLPDDPDAPGVVDFDGDGNPGATVIVTIPLLGEIELYIAQRAHSTLAGTLLDDGSLTGTVASLSLAQNTLDATNPLMRMSPDMSLDPERTHWWIVPVDSGECEGLVETMCSDHRAGPGC